ncbi:MAG: hypothetical protein KC441_14255 [Anaerolineales bacterium]|nr:hypothetical protein [Anaerolineales bacterium]
MARLPVPGSDNNSWGTILNEFLRIAHREDGHIKGVTNVINVRDYGAAGNGHTDDTAAIQAAIDAVKGPAQVPPFNKVGTVHFPQGTYLLSSPLQTFSGIHLVGEDFGAFLVASSGFSGSALITLEGLPKYYTVASISRLSFKSDAGTGIAAIQALAEVVGGCYFEDLHFCTANGLLLNTYTQYAFITYLYSLGPVDTILYLRGNFNTVRSIDKEAGETGQSAAPYVFLEGHSGGASTGNHLEHILIEGKTSPNKSALVLDGTAATTIHHFWNEPTSTDGKLDTNGYAIQILNSPVSTDLTGIIKHIFKNNRIRVVNSTGVTIQHLSTDGTDIPFQDGIEIDERSVVTVGQVYSRRGSNLFPLNQLGKQLHVQEHINRSVLSTELPGYLPRSRTPDAALHNLLQNPSFEAGFFQWRISQPEPTIDFMPSEVAPGLMAHISWPAVKTMRVLWQQVQLRPEWVGRTLTITALVRLEGDGCFVSPYIEGAGIKPAGGFQRANANTGWQLITQSFDLLSLSPLNIGLFFYVSDNPLEAFVDEVSVSFGTQSLRGTPNFQSLELGGRTMLSGVEAPGDGQWKQGDIVWNAKPAVQDESSGPYLILGWVCVAPGAPGTWVAIKTDVAV